MIAELRPPAAPMGRVDLRLDAGFVDDPYPTYARWREAGPVHWSEDFFGGAWVLTRHADVDAVLRDDRRFSAQRTGGWVMDTLAEASVDGPARGELQAFQQLFARAMLFLDAPNHGRLRGVVAAAFRGDAIERLRAFVEAWLAERLERLDRLDATAGFDAIAEIARPLPAEVIARLMGIADAERPEFLAWSDVLAEFIGAPRPTLELTRRAQQALLAMAGFFDDLARQRTRRDGDDLIGRLLQAQDAGTIVSRAELLAQCTMLLFAGHETTRNLIGNGLQALLSQRDQWERLCEAPGLVAGAVREVLRHDSPVQYTGRRVAVETEVHGRRLRRGELVVALIGAANRDPAVYDAPDRLDIGRRAGALLSFGAGPHVCIGAALSLLEAQAVIAAFARRWPGLRLASASPRRTGNPVYRGFVELQVRC